MHIFPKLRPYSYISKNNEKAPLPIKTKIFLENAPPFVYRKKKAKIATLPIHKKYLGNRAPLVDS